MENVYSPWVCQGGAGLRTQLSYSLGCDDAEGPKGRPVGLGSGDLVGSNVGSTTY